MAIIGENQVLFYYLTENLEMRSLVGDKIEDVVFDPGGPDEITLHKYVFRPTVDYICAGYYIRGFLFGSDSATEPYNDFTPSERLLLAGWNWANYTIPKYDYRKANTEMAIFINPVM